MIRLTTLSVILFVSSITCLAQSGRVELGPAATPTPQTVLLNVDVIDMFKAGLSESIIVAKIGASRTNFDTGIEALKQLKDAKIPESIVTKMIDASSEKVTEAAKPPNTEKTVEKSAEYLAAEKVIGVLRRLDNAVEVGITLQNYSSMLIESKSVLDENQSKLTDQPFIQKVNAAMLDHQYAANVWNLAVTNGWAVFFTKQEPGRTLVTKYGVPIKISIWTEIPVMTGLRYVWISSRNHYNSANVVFSKMSPSPEPSPSPMPARSLGKN